MADVQLESREGDQYASCIFLFQRFPEQVKGGFLIEGGTLRLASRGDSLRRKIELKKTLDGICSITVYLHLQKLLFPASLARF